MGCVRPPKWLADDGEKKTRGPSRTSRPDERRAFQKECQARERRHLRRRQCFYYVRICASEWPIGRFRALNFIARPSDASDESIRCAVTFQLGTWHSFKER